MANSAPYIRSLEETMRLRVNNKPIPEYARGFRNPVPKPPNGGSGYIIPLAKFIAKGFKFSPLFYLIDFVFPQPVSDGTLPSSIKDVGEQQTLQAKKISFTGGQSLGVIYLITVKVKRYFMNQFVNVITYELYGTGLIKDVFVKRTLNSQGDSQTFIVIIDTAPNGTLRTTERFTVGKDFKEDLESVKVTRQDGKTDTGGNLPSIEQIDTSPNNQFAASQALIEVINTSIYKTRSVIDPILFPEKFGYKRVPSTIPQPIINPRPAVIPTEIPEPLPDLDPDVDRKAATIEFPNPGETQYPKINPVPRPAKSPIPNKFPEPKINPDPQPNVNPKPDVNPKPKKKWSKITTYLPYPPVIIKTTRTKPPIVLDKTPTPLPLPEPVKPPPPIQTPIDKCADHCGGGTIDFNLPDDSDLLQLLAAIKKKVDEIEQSVNQTLAGSIEVGSCELPKDQTNETDEIVYVPDEAQKITYSEKGLKAIHTALQGIETKLTGMHEGICVTNDPPSAIPEWWQVRAGSDRPQLVVIFQGGTSKWSMAIPWYKGAYKSEIIELVPDYTRGSFSTVLTLNDNSKVVVNASSKAEGEKVMIQIKALINGSLLQNSELKSGGERKGRQIKSIKVKPVYAKYFAHGQQDDLPDWRYNFKTKKFTKYDRADT